MGLTDLHIYIYIYMYSSYQHSPPTDVKAPHPSISEGAYNHCNAPYQTIWCAYFSLIHSLTPGVSGQVALAALLALIALVIYHLTIHTRDPPHIYIYICRIDVEVYSAIRSYGALLERLINPHGVPVNTPPPPHICRQTPGDKHILVWEFFATLRINYCIIRHSSGLSHEQ